MSLKEYRYYSTQTLGGAPILSPSKTGGYPTGSNIAKCYTSQVHAEFQGVRGRSGPDLEALVQKRLATGAFANAEDVIRRALENLDAEES